MTVVGIRGDEFTLDGAPTYPGREFAGQRVQGLLFNVRAVQAMFDDANPATRARWAYPDTGVWDAERNVEEFCAALPVWRDHGVLAFTVNLQGGGPRYTPDVYPVFDNNGYTPEGALKPDYAARLARVLARADALGMVVIVGLFYVAHLKRLRGEEAIHRAARETVRFVLGTGRRNVLLEVANENREEWPWECLRPSRVHAFMAGLREAFPGERLLLSTSIVAEHATVPDSLIRASDYVLIHGNGLRPEGIRPYIRALREQPAFRENPNPVVCNEDSAALPNLEAHLAEYASWGYYEQGYGSMWRYDVWTDYSARERETRYRDLSGFQTPPVNWGVNTSEKRAFFERVAEITGY